MLLKLTNNYLYNLVVIINNNECIQLQNKNAMK